jgi:hypothetical protein
VNKCTVKEKTMTRKQKVIITILAVTLLALLALGAFHAGQYTYIRIHFGCDAPFEDWTQLDTLYYWVNGIVDWFRDALLEYGGIVYK